MSRLQASIWRHIYVVSLRICRVINDLQGSLWILSLSSVIFSFTDQPRRLRQRQSNEKLPLPLPPTPTRFWSLTITITTLSAHTTQVKLSQLKLSQLNYNTLSPISWRLQHPKSLVSSPSLMSMEPSQSQGAKSHRTWWPLCRIWARKSRWASLGVSSSNRNPV